MTDTWIPPSDLHKWALDQLKRIAKTVKQVEAVVEAETETFNRLLTMKSVRDVRDPSDDPLLLAWVLVNDVKKEAIDEAIKNAIDATAFAHHRIEQLNKLKAIIELGLKS